MNSHIKKELHKDLFIFELSHFQIKTGLVLKKVVIFFLKTTAHEKKEITQDKFIF